MLATLLHAVMNFSSTARVLTGPRLLVKLSPSHCEPDSLGVGTAHAQEPGEMVTCSAHLSAAAQGTQGLREQSAGCEVRREPGVPLPCASACCGQGSQDPSLQVMRH